MGSFHNLGLRLLCSLALFLFSASSEPPSLGHSCGPSHPGWQHLIEQRQRAINFSDFMKDLDLNPKLVWENTKKLSEGGFLTKIGRGQYRCSAFGESSFLMMSLGLRRLIHFMQLEEI